MKRRQVAILTFVPLCSDFWKKVSQAATFQLGSLRHVFLAAFARAGKRTTHCTQRPASTASYSGNTASLRRCGGRWHGPKGLHSHQEGRRAFHRDRIKAPVELLHEFA